MDVEFEQVEEGVVDEVDGAVDVLFDAEEELERAPGFVAGWEGDVGQLACSVGDVFACVAGLKCQYQLINRLSNRTYIVLFKQLTGIFSPTR